MKSNPDSRCPDCGQINGVHLPDCAGRIPCEECGGQFREHKRGCKKLYELNPSPVQQFQPEEWVLVVDWASPFYCWHGRVITERARRVDLRPDSAVIAWYYQCQMHPDQQSEPLLKLTFNQKQLKGLK